MQFFLSFINIQNIDISLLKSINLNRSPSLDNFFRDITNSAAFIAYSIPVMFLVISVIRKDTIILRNGLYMAASLLTSGIIGTVLKHSVNRPRPFITYTFIQNIARAGSPSFPSGHTCDAFAIATAICLVYPKRYVILLCYAWACAVAYSRMDLGVHYPSDVLAGIVIGSGSAFFWYQFKSKATQTIKTK
jgi:membrane-associated phospholipid phosphatase